MPAETHHDHPLCCTRFSAPRPTVPLPTKPAPRSMRRRNAGLGFFIVFLIATAFLAVNASTLFATERKVRDEKRLADEAARPASVEVTILKATCPDCYDVTKVIAALASNDKVKIAKTNEVDIAQPEGVAIMRQDNLPRVPTIIIKGDTSKLLKVMPGLKPYGELRDGVFVGTKLPPPYLEMPEGNKRGTFKATYVTEKACTECYDPILNRQALAQLDMTPSEEATVDRNDADGKQLVKQYAMTTTPAVILTGDLDAYEGFDKIWANVGTIEKDGAYVFRNTNGIMGTYFDLTTKKTVVPAQNQTNTNTSTQAPSAH